ncbi:MAG: OmpA family protein [Cytophagales bacterium]|nr:OmpA family protein [Cytophagales bacterium]
MEDITASAQIHEHTLRGSILFGLLLLLLPCFGQNFHTKDKKAIKLYEKSEEQFKSRDFEGGIKSLNQALERDPDFAEAYLKLAGVYNYLRAEDASFANYQRYYETIPKEEVNPKIARGLAVRYYQRGKYEKASEVLNYYLSSLKGNVMGKGDSVLLHSIEYSHRSLLKPMIRETRKLSDSVNRFSLQYFPVLTIDNQSIVYTKRDGTGIQFDEDIVIAHKKNGVWETANGIASTINTGFNEGACSISADGRTLIFTSCEGRRSYGSCDLYYVIREGDEWGKPKNLGKTVNSSSWDSQPSLSADGKTLYFVSNRPGGHGKRDIWVTQQKEGVWTKPTNLGPRINTAQDESTPFIHFNGESLFFSSKGHVGLGGFDLYVSERSGDEWTNPVNLGYPTNDFEDQSGLFITADGKMAFYTDESENRSELFSFDIEVDTLLSHKASYLTGLITNKETDLPIEAKLELYDLITQEKLYSTTSDPVTGRYFMALFEGGEYGAYASADGFLFEDFQFDLQSSVDLKPDTLNISLNPLRSGETIILENVYFEFDSYALIDKSKSELDLVFQFLKKNEKLEVEIAGHTDASGGSAYNLDLSEKRAKSVYDFLVEKGIPGSRMKYKGYGSQFPVSQSEQQTDDSKNRRIEFRILGTLDK